MKKHIKAVVLLCLCCALLGWAYLSMVSQGDALQYLIPAPAVQKETPTQGEPQQPEEPQQPARPNQDIAALWDSLQTKAEGWTGAISAYSLTGILEKAAFAGDTGITAVARLNAVSPGRWTIEPEYLRFGRLFYPEELQKGCKGILLDEQLALALFRISEPLGRTVTLAGEQFTVLGVLRHSRRVGDSEDYAAYITLADTFAMPLQLQALAVVALPVHGGGAHAMFQKDMESWQGGGTLIDLAKERMGAMLSLRVLVVYLGCGALFTLLRVLNRKSKAFMADYRARLEWEYAQKLMPRLIAGIVRIIIGYVCLVSAASVLVKMLIEPVYTFTEWVPAILVEWKEIQTAFWRVWQGAASLQELRSPQLCRIRYFAMLTAWCSAVLAVLCTSLWVRVCMRLKMQKDNK